MGFLSFVTEIFSGSIDAINKSNEHDHIERLQEQKHRENEKGRIEKGKERKEERIEKTKARKYDHKIADMKSYRAETQEARKEQNETHNKRADDIKKSSQKRVDDAKEYSQKNSAIANKRVDDAKEYSQKNSAIANKRVDDAKEYAEKRIESTSENTGSLLQIQNQSHKQNQHMLETVYSSKDQYFNQAISMLEDVFSDGKDSFDDILENDEKTRPITESKNKIKSKNEVIKEELIIIINDIKHLNTDLTAMEASKKTILEIREKFSDSDLKIKLKEKTVSILIIAGEINNKEIEQIKKEHELEISNEQLQIIKDHLRSLEKNNFNLLSKMQSDLRAGRKMNEQLAILSNSTSYLSKQADSKPSNDDSPSPDYTDVIEGECSPNNEKTKLIS